MDTLNHILVGFTVAVTPLNLFFCFVGVFVGTLIGVLPGIGPTGTMAILLPFTFTMGPIPAIIMLAGIYYGAQYGGSTTAILVNIPGEVGSIVTCLDGYQMARQGRAGPALGISAIGSFVGGTFGIVGLMFLVPPLAKLARSFGPPELFSLIIFGMMMISTLGGGDPLKSFIVATLGLFVSLIGKEAFSGFGRFTFGNMTLADGLGLVPVSMGWFGIAEVIANMEVMAKQEVYKTDIKSLIPTLKDWLTSRWAIIRGTMIGFFLGAVPGTGLVITSFFAYWMEKRLSKYPEKFGTGVIEGVAAPESANNAATAGTLISLLALGLPTSPSMAMLMGAFIIQGIQPGPRFIGEYPELFWGVVASMYIGNVMLVILNLPLIGLWVRILKIPSTLLFPLIVLFCFVGVYSLNNNVFELFIMILFGGISYILKKLKYPMTPFILAMVLGPMLETSFRHSMMISLGRPAIFFQRPISAIILLLVGITLLISLILSLKKKRLPALK